MSTCCLFVELLDSVDFLRALTTVSGCRDCPGAWEHEPVWSLQSCALHAAQFDSALTLLAEHCPCRDHGGGDATRIATRMAKAHDCLAQGRSALMSAVRHLAFALNDAETERAFARLRHVYPVSTGGTLRCAFSERPRRWVRQRMVASAIAPTVLEQEALAALILAAGFGHPAADLPDEPVQRAGAMAESDGSGHTGDSGTVPVVDLAGRSVGTRRHAPPVSVATAEYLLRKLEQRAEGADAARARTTDQWRRVRLGEELAGVSARGLAGLLCGVLSRLAERLPEHFALLEAARGRSRGAPYRPVVEDATPVEAPVKESVEKARPATAEVPPDEDTWLRWTVTMLLDHARRHPAVYAANPEAALDRFLTCHLREHAASVPTAWAGALRDDEARADLLEALATAANTSEAADQRQGSTVDG
ncbi:hypothetical protein [Salinactinospora qingdaonensis]|uniref:Uncharacterized protein n=1 Tax=Salinactinospora qingdaonensis TaxID=702744 RepID=A0ABP7FUA4_9ACTN